MGQQEDAITAVFRAQLSALAAELGGERREDRLRRALDELMRVQAILVPDAEAAVACIAGLHATPNDLEPLGALAVELFTRHRERIGRIRAGESSRARFVASRARQEIRPSPCKSQR